MLITYTPYVILVKKRLLFDLIRVKGRMHGDYGVPEATLMLPKKPVRGRVIVLNLTQQKWQNLKASSMIWTWWISILLVTNSHGSTLLVCL